MLSSEAGMVEGETASLIYNQVRSLWLALVLQESGLLERQRGTQGHTSA